MGTIDMTSQPPRRSPRAVSRAEWTANGAICPEEPRSGQLRRRRHCSRLYRLLYCSVGWIGGYRQRCSDVCLRDLRLSELRGVTRPRRILERANGVRNRSNQRIVEVCGRDFRSSQMRCIAGPGLIQDQGRLSIHSIADVHNGMCINSRHEVARRTRVTRRAATGATPGSSGTGGDDRLASHAAPTTRPNAGRHHRAPTAAASPRPRMTGLTDTDPTQRPPTPC